MRLDNLGTAGGAVPAVIVIASTAATNIGHPVIGLLLGGAAIIAAHLFGMRLGFRLGQGERFPQ